MALYEQDEYAEKHLAGVGRWFWLGWIVVTVVGSAAGRIAVDSLSQFTLNGVVNLQDSQAVRGATAGLCIGFAQALVLWPYLKRRGALQWIGATVLGRTVRALVITLLLDFLFSVVPNEAVWSEFIVVITSYFAVMAVVGAAAGAAGSIPQRFVLVRRVTDSNWWVWTNVGTSVITFIATASVLYSSLLVTIPPEKPSFCTPDCVSTTGEYYAFYTPLSLDSTFAVWNDIVVGAITGYAMMHILRHPTSQAEWSMKLKEKRRRIPKRFAETQPSPEALLEQERKWQTK